MQIRQIPIITYETLASRFKNITTHSFHDPKGISIIHTKPKGFTRLDQDIYTFDKDILISRDILIKTKNGEKKQIFTSFYKNGITTTIKETNKELQKLIATTIDKTIVPLSQIRKKQSGSFLIGLKNKISNKKIDGTIPVTIIKKETKIEDMVPHTEYNIFAHGKTDSIRIKSDDQTTYVTAKNKHGEQTFDLGQIKNPHDPKILNKLFNWFINENNGFQ